MPTPSSADDSRKRVTMPARFPVVFDSKRAITYSLKKIKLLRNQGLNSRWLPIFGTEMIGRGAALFSRLSRRLSCPTLRHLSAAHTTRRARI